MSEIEKINEMDAAEVVAMARDRERVNDERLKGEAAGGAGEVQPEVNDLKLDRADPVHFDWGKREPERKVQPEGFWNAVRPFEADPFKKDACGQKPGPRVLPNVKDPFVEMLEKEKKRLEEKKQETEAQLRREAKDSVALGGLCGLGVVSLVAAASTGYWIPVAVGLGICLSGAAAILCYRGMVVLRK